MSANHSDCRYAIRGDRVPVAGTRDTTLFIYSYLNRNRTRTVSGGPAARAARGR